MHYINSGLVIEKHYIVKPNLSCIFQIFEIMYLSAFGYNQRRLALWLIILLVKSAPSITLVIWQNPRVSGPLLC